MPPWDVEKRTHHRHVRADIDVTVTWDLVHARGRLAQTQILDEAQLGVVQILRLEFEVD